MTGSRLTVRTVALHTLIVDRWPGGTEARLCAELERVMPRVVSVMVLATPDGYPTSTVGALDRGGNASDGHDRLGSLVARRKAATDAYAALSALVGRAAASVALKDRQDVRQALSAALALADDWNLRPTDDEKRVARQRAQCIKRLTTDPQGAPWVDDHCENIADAGRRGMCEACYRRRLRHLQQLEERAS